MIKGRYLLTCYFHYSLQNVNVLLVDFLSLNEVKNKYGNFNFKCLCPY